MKLTKLLLAAALVALVAVTSTAPERPVHGESAAPEAAPPDLIEFRWLELATEADGLDLRAGHLAESVSGFLAVDPNRFGTLELADPELAIARLRKLGDLRVIDRARMTLSSPKSSRFKAEYSSGTKLPIRATEHRGEEQYVKTVFERIGADVEIQHIDVRNVTYEVRLAGPVFIDLTAGATITNCAWQSTAALPTGHTLVLASQVRYEPLQTVPLRVKADGIDVKSKKADTRIWIVLITRTALR